MTDQEELVRAIRTYQTTVVVFSVVIVLCCAIFAGVMLFGVTASIKSAVSESLESHYIESSD